MTTKFECRQSKMDIVRAIYDEICQKREDGWRVCDIARWLDTNGVIGKSCFRAYLYRIDREHGRSNR